MQVIHDVSELDKTFLETDTLDKTFLTCIISYITNKNLKKTYTDESANAEFLFDYLPHGTTVKTIRNETNVCHNPWTTLYKHGVASFLLLKIGNIIHAEGGKQIYDFILGENSPWKSVLDDLTVLVDKEGHPLFILFRNMNIDIHVLTNLVIATRYVTEFRYGCLFSLLKSATFTDHEAFFLCKHFRWDSICKKYRLNTPRYGDLCFNYTTPFLPFSRGEIKFGWNNKSRPNPCNYIWGTSDSNTDHFLTVNNGHGSGYLDLEEIQQMFTEKKVSKLKTILSLGKSGVNVTLDVPEDKQDNV